MADSSRPRSEPALRTIRLTILEVVKGGEGLARVEIDGSPKTVLVSGAAPRDVLDVSIHRSQGILRGRIDKIVEPSPHRIRPPCAFASRCGGCDLMHLTRQAQREAKLAIVRSALSNLAGSLPSLISHAPLADASEGYRCRARLAAQSSGSARSAGIVVGFRAARSHDIVAVPECIVLDPVLEQTRREMSDWLKGSRGEGEILLAVGHNGKAAIVLAWDGELNSHVFAHAEKQVDAGAWAGVEIRIEAATEPARIGDARTYVQGADGLALAAPSGGFVQSHPSMNRLLVERARDLSRAKGQEVLELFAGAGNFSIELARLASHLETVENDPEAVRLARHNLLIRSLSARVREGDANAVDIQREVRVVLLDPPRTGAKEASKRIAESGARRVVMVSCDPATLARDLHILLAKERFRITDVEVFEMFPHTSHMEIVVGLDREGRR